MGTAVDIESTVKARDSRVDVTKLAKAEAKLKAKRDKKKDRFVEFEESRLVKARDAQKSYEELFLEGRRPAEHLSWVYGEGRQLKSV